MDAVRKLAATQGKRFAVIADEAHSSQSGEAAAEKLKAVLSAEELAELKRRRRGEHGRPSGGADGDTGERRWRNYLRSFHGHAEDQDDGAVRHPARPHAARRRGQSARPRSMCIPCARPSRKSSSSTCCRTTPATSWPSSWRTNGKDYDDKTVERSAAMKGIMGWVRLHPYNIAQKVQIVVEHFRAYVAPLLGGKAKAMVVVASRVGGRALAAGDGEVQGRARLQAAHARRVLRRGGRQDLRPGRLHGRQPGAEPQPEGPRHSRSLQGGRVSDPACRETSSRPASISRCSAGCMSTSGSPASRRCRRSRA